VSALHRHAFLEFHYAINRALAAFFILEWLSYANAALLFMRLVVCKVAEQFVKNNEIAQVNFVPRAARRQKKRRLCCTIYRPTDLIHVLHLILTHPPLNEELFTTCRRGLFSAH